jgi:hypothetical protein
MPYNNETNREISKKVNSFNQSFIDNERQNHQYFSGGAMRYYSLKPDVVGSARKDTRVENTNENDFVYNPNKFAFQTFGKATQPETSASDFLKSIGYVESAYDNLEGDGYGSIGGFAKGTRMDTGEGTTLGISGKGKDRIIGGKRGRKKKETGVAIFKEERMKGGKLTKKPRNIGKEFNLLEKMKGVANKLGIPIDNMEKKETEGGKRKRGRPIKMVGGVDLARPYNMVNEKGLTGDGKKKKIKLLVGGKLVPKAQMKSSTMSGFGKKQKRGEIVKKIMKERGCSLGEASRIIKEEKLM